jgi:hypothetical protein
MDEYCVELLRQATLTGDLEAWRLVQRCLSETVRGWMKLHPRWAVAAGLDSEENYVDRTFERLYEASVCKRVQFSCLADVLRYLQVSLNSVILDSLRSFSRPRKIAPQKASDSHESAAAQADSSEIWQRISKSFPDARKQRIAFLLFNCGLGPKDIVRTFPEEFNNVREIALLRCTIIGRLLDDMDHHNGTIDAGRKQTTAKREPVVNCGDKVTEYEPGSSSIPGDIDTCNRFSLKVQKL